MFPLTLTSCHEDAEISPNPLPLTFEVNVHDGDITRSAYPTDIPWTASLKPKNKTKRNNLTLSCNVQNEIIQPDTDSVPVTRGTLVSAISSFGVSAAVYTAASTYSSEQCGNYFFNQQVTAGVPTSWFWPGSGKKAAFYAYYPYGSSCFTLSSTATSVGVPSYSYTVPSAVADQPDIMTAQTTDIAGDTGGSVSLSFQHKCAALRFSLTNEGSDAMTVTSISVSGVYGSGTLQGDTWTPGTPASTFTLAPTGGWTIASNATVNLTGTSNIFFMVPQTLPSGAKLVIVTSEDTYEAELSGSWIAGKTYNYGITKSESSPTIDLSMVDNAGNARASMTTANCYLVHAAGDYKLPLVYGNAIKNGAPNTVAFNPGGSASSTYTTQFVNHAGTGISGPWITKSGSGVNAGMDLSAASAALLWQDRTGLISAISVDNDYLYFTVGTFGGGNALIAVRDDSGNNLWSWHIWATTETLASTTTVATGSHNYAVAPVNLGWVPTGGSGKQGYCTYYQWGRKDPFIPASAYNSTTNHTVYAIDGTTATGINYSATGVTIADNIKYPTTHYYNSSNYGPCNTTYYNMWDAQNKATNNVTSATKKTIYDPCPPGFCVPTGNLYCYMGNGLSNPTSSTSRSDSNWNSTNKGKTWTLNGASIYFPAAGSRINSLGALFNVGALGYCWSATPYNTNSGRSLYFRSGYWDWDNFYRANGFSVRPVAEE